MIHWALQIAWKEGRVGVNVGETSLGESQTPEPDHKCSIWCLSYELCSLSELPCSAMLQMDRSDLQK